jgi:ABC-type phosphate transport system substrate-binding protein
MPRLPGPVRARLRRVLRLAVLGSGFLLCAARPGGHPVSAAPPEAPLVIVVNRANPLDDIDFDELRRVFLAERTHWPHGRKRITLVMRERGHERDAALRMIHRMSERDFKRHFLRAVFTGQVESPPKVLSTAAGVRRFVFHVPSAIGYVRAGDLDGSVKVLRVDGHAPGEPGYPLNLPPS